MNSSESGFPRQRKPNASHKRPAARGHWDSHQLVHDGVILVGLLANTCIESTGRFAMELGYHVTLVRDATAAFTHEMMHAAHELNGPTFAHAIVSTSELVAGLSVA